MVDETSESDRRLTVIPPAGVSVPAGASVVVPGIIADAGERATRRFLEFFAANIPNRNTRMAYMTAVGRFFAWCEQNQIGQLVDIEPLHVAAYIGTLKVLEKRKAGAEPQLKDATKPTTKQHLACCSTG